MKQSTQMCAIAVLGAMFMTVMPNAASAENECSAYGINSHLPSMDGLEMIKAAGFDWVRFDFNWFQLEPSKGNFNWGVADAVVNKAHSLGLNIFPTLSYTPKWAAQNQDCVPGQGKCSGCNTQPIANVNDWKNFVTAVVNRYKDKIGYWGLWNEPNLDGFFCGTEDQYVYDILIPGAEAVHAADPSAKTCGPELAGMTKGDEWHGDEGTCLFGGCIFNGWEISLANVLDKGGAHIDIITHHFYSDTPTTLADEVLDGEYTVIKTNSSLKEIVEGHGQGQPVWLTEWGWNTKAYGGYQGGGDETDSEQALYLVEFYKIQKQIVEGTYGDSDQDPWPQFQRLFLYDWHDGVDGEGKLWSYGIVNVDGDPKEAYGALKDYMTSNPANCGSSPDSKPPTLSGIPDVNLVQGKGRPHAVDLHDHADDPDTAMSQLVFSVISSSAGDTKVAIADGHFLSVIPENNWTGNGKATVQVGDGSGSDTTEVAIKVSPAQPPNEYQAPRIDDISIDAVLGEWGPAYEVGLSPPADWAGLKGEVPSSSDCKAAFKLAWTPGYLYLAVEVTDDTQSNNYAPDAIWMGDGIQIGIDGAGDKNGPGYDGSNDWEIGVALTADGNDVFCWHVPPGVQGCPLMFDIKRQGGKTIYEVRIAGDFSDELGFNMVVNDDDGAGRQGWLEWTPGIGLGKNPSLFGTVLLVEEAEPPPDQGPGDDIVGWPDIYSPPEETWVSSDHHVPSDDAGLVVQPDGRTVLPDGKAVVLGKDAARGDGSVPWVVKDDLGQEEWDGDDGGCSLSAPRSAGAVSLLALFLVLFLAVLRRKPAGKLLA